MKVMTCCWFDTERLEWEGREGNRVVSVSRGEPAGFLPDHKIFEFCPSAALLGDFKNKRINELEYTKRYNEEVSPRLDAGITQLRDGDILCCWEPEGTFCHRRILAILLKDRGIEVEVH